MQITSVLSVGNLIDDLVNPSDIVIEKILKFASKRRDILEKIVLDNSEQVNDILVKHGKLRLIFEYFISHHLKTKQTNFQTKTLIFISKENITIGFFFVDGRLLMRLYDLF